ncbi:hypothetical protein C0580_03510 [Candidatus Parcubacteria bacterium]|nr:MAG: hypothetical protein C0580_03510 [Candidatus Parcubacteria bacterium]
MFRENIQICYNKGYSLLLAILVIGAISVAITISLILLGIDSSRTSFALEQSKQARGLANACAESALQEIRNSTPFTGSDTIIFSNGSCSYTVVNDGGNNRTIESSGEVGDTIKKINISIDQINPDINIVSWQELADF